MKEVTFCLKKLWRTRLKVRMAAGTMVRMTRPIITLRAFIARSRVTFSTVLKLSTRTPRKVAREMNTVLMKKR